MDAEGISFVGINEALKIPESELRLFGKPVSYKTRRMGVALARGGDVTEARTRAKAVANAVIPKA